MRWEHRLVERRRRVRERSQRLCNCGLLAVLVGFADVSCIGDVGPVEDRSVGSGEHALDSADADQAGQAGSLATMPRSYLAGSPGTSGSYAGQRALAMGGESANTEPLPVSSYVGLSEVKFDPPGTDGNYEFVELRGQPGTTLSGFWLVALEGDQESNRGQVDVLVDLAKCDSKECLFDQNGLLLLVPDPSATVPPAGAQWRLSAEFAKGGLENGTVTLLLLAGSTLPSAVGADWDNDDDGVLEIPDGVSIEDAAAWTDGDTEDVAYAPIVLGPKPKPQAIWTCVGRSAMQWGYGQLLGDSASLTVDVAHSVPAGLEAFELTPGSQNQCQQLLGVAGASSAGASGVGGVFAGEAGAGYGGTAFGSNSAASRAGAPVGGAGRADPGGSSSSDGGRQGSANVGLGGSAILVSSNGGNMISTTATIVAGRGSATNQSPLDTEVGQQHALAGCAGRDVLVVGAPLARSAGDSGWWSPTPFQVPPRGRAAGAGGVGPAKAPLGGAEQAAPSPPVMPTGCRIQTNDAGLAQWLLLLGLGGAACLRRKSSGITKKFLTASKSGER